MTDQLHFSGDRISSDAMRCRPADAPLVVEATWQPAYVGPPPASIRNSNSGNAYRVTARRRLVDLAENLLLAAATWLDERGRRTR